MILKRLQSLFQLNYYPYDSYVSHQKDFNGSETEYSEILTRRRRDTGLGDALSEPLFSPMEHPLNENPYDANCYEGYAGCVNIVCNITNFSKNSGNVVLTIRSRLYTKTVQNVSFYFIVSHLKLDMIVLLNCNNLAYLSRITFCYIRNNR